ncbi:ABC-type spermidine/putrescine transport system, permease component I [Pseudooceanicola antarcticus]|uniref:ABC transporter permease n=1 Tax=Pseudooceanicola antarcticus TaxID=1247613 RepID=A0A285J4A8_9RHOB|nr:ABC transporter permease [Pseudooceanicola antarcticus]PJE29674.1 ABC transporter permease [Pseudooceanicola antarcticus]SNY54893.1 ABC-type spermidine/putrescine transport system, permease component I [Pseudooceanicola antarcticus]
MKDLVRGYGRGLTALFFAAALGWGLMLIILPQLTMLERAVTAPARQLDSSIARRVMLDAGTCISVLGTYQPAEEEAPAETGALAIPSMGGASGGMAVPSMGGSSGGMAVPSMGNATADQATRPYILQCDRATTHTRLVRDTGAEAEYLDTLYGAPSLSVDDSLPLDQQIAQAEEIAEVARALFQRLQEEEANAFPYTLDNFETLAAPRLIPMSAEARAEEDQLFSNRLLSLAGLRYEQDGQVYERIGLVTLTRTIVFALMATALALVLCYPIAYKVALAAPPKQALWLFLGLIIPYTIVELMRVYAWTTIIDNQGLINSVLSWAGVISDPIQFKRFPGTIFLVIVYTYVLFMVFPIYNVMSTLDKNQIEAAKDLGASAVRVHRRVIIPHSKPGIAVGCIATFMLSAGAFSVPRIISRGLQAEWFSQTIYNKFFESENSNVGAAYSFGYTLICFALVALFMWAMRTRLKDFARVQ